MEDIFKDKVILITGGTGFLGRALAREILKYNPAALRILSRDEVKHHQFQEKFNYDDRLRNLIGDVRDYNRMLKATKGCDIVIHAAALKRLDILEYNVDESIQTNIIGTLNVVNACLANDVKKAVYISTDKACYPANTYGACKFVSERIFIESNYSRGTSPTVFTAVRYGNVLESTGSVIPFFSSKIRNGERIPLTDARMTRFIISPDEAVQLVFAAIRHCAGGDVFIPQLPAFKITDLIQILQEKFNRQVGTKVIGIRPGEKLHELMINACEVPRTFTFGKYYVISSHIEKTDVRSNSVAYLDENKRLTEAEMTDYSSKDAVISVDKVKKLFTDLGLL
ncbi:SDR family NAD(P)-dependent oxidoreductase [Nanoarchaeota archaeon]